MNLRLLGKTGLIVSPIGLGLAALGRPGYINVGHADDFPTGRDVESMEAHAHAVLDTAYKAGVRYVDAARSYGRAEAFLASWLKARGIKPGDLTIGSKWGYTYTAGWKIEAEAHEIKEHSLANLTRQVAESRAILGDHLNLYQIHSATLESGVLDNKLVLDALDRLRAEGLKIGLSLTGPRQADTLRKALKTGVFDCVQATWNILEPSVGPMLAEASAIGMGVIVKEALANGRLTERNVDPGFARNREIIHREAARLATTADSLGLATVLAEPWVDVVLSGAATFEQLRSNLEATRVELDDEARHALSGLSENPDAYWSTRAKLPWN